MKRGILVFVIIICSFSVVYAAPGNPEYSDSAEHMMVGFVNSKAHFLPTIFYDVLPFDLDGSDVRYNSNKDTMVQGLAIGSYTLISNTTFHLYVSHSPLVLSGEVPSGKLGSVDYRLYLMINTSGVEFFSCLSDSSEDPKLATNRICLDTSLATNGMLALFDNYMYVSLEDAFYTEESLEESTMSVVERLASGTYQSTIHFLMEEI